MRNSASVNGGTSPARTTSVSTKSSNQAEFGSSSNASLARDRDVTRDTTISVEPKEDNDDFEVEESTVKTPPAPKRSKRKSPTKNKEASNGGNKWPGDQVSFHL